jgi:hypothetical protein
MENILSGNDLWKQMLMEGFNFSDLEALADKITLSDKKQLEDIILKQIIEINRLRRELEKIRDVE